MVAKEAKDKNMTVITMMLITRRVVTMIITKRIIKKRTTVTPKRRLRSLPKQRR